MRDSAALAVLLTLSVGSGRDLSLFVGLGMAVEHFRLRLGREAIRFFGWAVGAIRRIGLYRLDPEDILLALLELIRHTWSKRPL